jgi:ABC-type multidrug transport system fused ATPase/permease subunit
VDFTYPGRERPAVAGFDLHVAQGETVALVGSSGAGKTTVLNLLLGFLEPAAGSIELDGRDIRYLAPDELHRLVTLVPQDPYVFHGTIEDNIRLGKPDASPEEIRHAAEAADIARFVEAAEAGYQTPVGERGMTLSSGQRQRLAIARAVLLDAPALLLDEATANLDGESETTVVRALAEMAGGRTTIIVAHRMSTVRAADRVVVLADGEIAEAGPHEELVLASGFYRRMVDIEQDARAGGVA